jgi:hypothetical protein
MRSIRRKSSFILSFWSLVLIVPCSITAMPNFTIGVWQNVEPAVFHSPSNMQTIAVVVNPQNSYVYAAASNKTNGGNGSTGIYRSTDCGSSWILWSTGTGASNLATGELWAMLIDPVSPQNMYVANGYGDNNTLFKSSDGGVDWVPLNVDPNHILEMQFVQAIALEPNNPNHLAVTFHINGRAPYNSNVLSTSTDGGATWKLFNGPSQVGGWREAATLTILGPASYVYGSDGGVYVTSNEGGSWSTAIGSGMFGRYAGSTELTPDGTTLYISTGAGIHYSRANGGTPLGASWTLIPNTQGNITNFIDDGVTVYGFHVNGPCYTANLNTPTVWTQMQNTGITNGSNMMAYDPANHIIYSANFGNGLMALKTRAASTEIRNLAVAPSTISKKNVVGFAKAGIAMRAADNRCYDALGHRMLSTRLARKAVGVSAGR